MIFTKMLKWSEVAQLCPTLCDPMDCSHPWDFPGKSTGMGCHVVLQITDMSGDLISKSESYYLKEAKVKPKSVHKSLWIISYSSICFPKDSSDLKWYHNQRYSYFIFLVRELGSFNTKQGLPCLEPHSYIKPIPIFIYPI